MAQLKMVFVVLAWLALLALGGLTMLPGFAGDQHLFELLSHFRVHYALFALLLLPAFGLLKRPFGLILTIALTLWNAFDLAPWLLAPENRPVPQGKPLKLLMSNLLFSNHDTKALQSLIREANPDIVIIQELNGSHIALMEGALKKTYPHREFDRFQGAFGIGLWSKLPLAEVQRVYLGPARLPNIYARLNWEGEPLQILTSHPYPPVDPEATAARNGQYWAIADFLDKHPGRQILIGDLNTTPWSPQYRRLETLTGLRNARLGFGLLPSWPTHYPALLRIPIDHALLSPTLQVKDITVGPDLGSDHLPLLLTIGR